MRLLFVVDYYPPLEQGGYSQLCRDLAHELRRRGHEVTVLTAQPSKGVTVQDSEPIIRRLLVPVRFEDRWPVPVQQVVFLERRLAHNQRLFAKVLRETGAEAVVFWPTGAVDRTLMCSSEADSELTVAYYLAGVTPQQPSVLRQFWAYSGHSQMVRLIKSVFRSCMGRDSRLDPRLLMHHVMCVSEHERQRAIGFGLAPEHAVVVHNGIDLAQFPFRGLPSACRHSGSALRVLYAGRLVESKGTLTVVEAIGWLRRNHSTMQVSLTLLGAGAEAYVRAVDRFIANEDLAGQVTRRAWIPREQMPDFMSTFDVLVLPTIHPEPLARVVHEAMALGLNIVATPTGGTPEMVRQDETGLLFTQGNATELGECLLRLQYDLSLCDHLALSALTMVREKFTIQAMGAQVEEYLLAWHAAKPDFLKRVVGL